MSRWTFLDGAVRLLRSAKPRAENTPPPAPPVETTSLSGIEAVLAPHATLIRRIRVAYGYADDQFQQHLLGPIHALAAWLHFLPGHPDGGFEHRGGAIEQGLTNCLFSLQAADGRIFEESTQKALSLNATQRWRLACALGGLFVPLSQVLGRIEVASDEGCLWPASAVPLLHWLESLPAAKYHYRWARSRETFQWLASYPASRCIDPEVMSFLTAGDAHAAAALLRSIAGSDRPMHDPVSDVVGKVAVAVAAREQVRGAAPPVHLLASTLTRLLGTSDWLPNSPGGHVWFGTDGLYLFWPDAAIKLLEAMPRGMTTTAGFASPDDLLRQLAMGGIVHTVPSPLFSIHPPGHAKPQAAVRVMDAHRIVKEAGLRNLPLELQLCMPVVSSVNAKADSINAVVVNSDSEVPQSEKALNDETALTHQFRGAPEGQDASDDPQIASQPLTLNTSRITNFRSRKLVDDVVHRLDQSFDTMLAKIVVGGVFVALTEFVGEGGDGAAIVRALHGAGLLIGNDGTQARRVVSERIEGADVAGVVLPAIAFQSYSNWVSRWHDGTRCPSINESLLRNC